jgi:hypothetical protein
MSRVAQQEASMLRMKRALQFLVVALTAIAFTSLSSPSLAQQSGIVRLEIVKAGFIVGVSGGKGVLIYKGRRYSLGVGGVSLGATVGASKAVLSGRAYNLRNAGDIAGTYGAATTGVAVLRGRGAARLRNARGVVLELRGREVGVEFSLDLSGMTIALRP